MWMAESSKQRFEAAILNHTVEYLSDQLYIQIRQHTRTDFAAIDY